MVTFEIRPVCMEYILTGVLADLIPRGLDTPETIHPDQTRWRSRSPGGSYPLADLISLRGFGPHPPPYLKETLKKTQSKVVLIRNGQ